MDFVNGKADPWGMKVNPSYKKIKLPTLGVAAAGHLHPADPEHLPPGQPRRLLHPARRARSPRCARSPRRCSTAGRTCRPAATTTRSRNTYKLGRVDRQSYGARFMLGVVSLGDAARYGLRTAALQTKKGTYVAPTRTRSRRVDLMQPQPPARAARAAGGRLTARRMVRGCWPSRSGHPRPERAGPAVRARPGRRPQVGRRLPGHDGRLHRREAAEPEPGRRGQGRPVHPDLDHRGPEAGRRQRRAAGRLPADREEAAPRRKLYDLAQDVAAPSRRRRRSRRQGASPRRLRRRAHRRPPPTDRRHR